MIDVFRPLLRDDCPLQAASCAYERFTEGFTTPDLLEAEALLEEL